MQLSRAVSHRLLSIDLLRGFVMVVMVLDHVRETFFLHLQVLDPMDVSQTSLGVYIARMFAHLCAPVFVFLTGLSAYLYGQNCQSKQEISSFLFKRGIFLVILEITIINFAWTSQFPPQKLYLQVIWAIGLSMLALSILIYLPRYVLAILGITIIAGHNLLDNIHASESSIWYVPWAILHDRVWVVVSESFQFRTTYPVLPWIGVISLGYVAGEWFKQTTPVKTRQNYLLYSGLLGLVMFIIIRFVNVYGDKLPRIYYEQSFVETVMSFFNVTKYPPSLQFLILTLSFGMLLLLVFERIQNITWIKLLAVYGSVPLFFYILHLYVLKVLYLIAESIWGKNQGEYYGFDNIEFIFLWWIILVITLYPAVKLFSNFKSNHKELTWLKYL